MSARTSWLARWIAVPCGVLAVSTSGVLIRLTTAPPVTTAAHRMLWASVLLLAIALLTQRAEFHKLNRRSLVLLGGSGVLLGVHFVLWTTSLFWTSVASAVLLVDTHPVMVALAARAFLGETPPVGVWLGMALALLGSMVIGAGDLEIGVRALIGDAMALAAAATFAGYLVIGRHVRQGLGVAVYAGLVYSVAGVLIAGLALVSGTSLTAFSTTDALVWLALVCVPTLCGHTVLNWALRHVPASVVSVSVLGEPLVMTVLAWQVLGETPTATAVVGGAVLLAGLYLSLRSAPSSVAPDDVTRKSG